ncbi:epoxide hydrolase family protein [Pseudomonas sp. PD9R]|uniref:epoxide hydrolase family protein n=1 Tax=Pseudomonas sp. PD9R TaxID=2853534 RepID=UPI001C4388E5|nr:epoxide hydrolase family protein [Pseudomonas sp. PD9R]MBV6823129.1 epoxide hydrolase [Pseudomonas sp. PD9R]
MPDAHNDLPGFTLSRRHLIAGAASGIALAASGLPLAVNASAIENTPVGNGITPFRVKLDPSVIVDLRQRLTTVRWPDAGTTADWSQGVPLAKAKALTDYWRRQYDMTRLEKRLNAFPQFRTSIDGLGIHFIHVKSRHANALPMILTHGWPGSVVEFLDTIDPLVNPTAHGGTVADAFHVVIPSMPGYGFSDKPTTAGWGLPRIAQAWDMLMKRLGYAHYVAQGGDLGAGVASWMSKQQPQGLAAIHLNLPILFPPPPPGAGGYTPAEQAALNQLIHYGADLSGYASIQGSRPQTLGYGLADSPIGQAMWIYEKFQAWTDNRGDPADAIAVDKMLDNIMLYWVTDTAASSARLYKESFNKDFVRFELAGPVAVSIFKGDIFTPPKSWGDQTYSKLTYWNEVPAGGHFAALEKPGSFVEELRKALKPYRLV